MPRQPAKTGFHTDAASKVEAAAVAGFEDDPRSFGDPGAESQEYLPIEVMREVQGTFKRYSDRLNFLAENVAEIAVTLHRSSQAMAFESSTR
jgi:hypothetical protein